MNEVKKIKPSGIFTNYIYKTIPLAFDESMSYYETLLGVLNLLKEQEIVINNNADLLAELESYVKNYFDNLDVQEEINNKLDEMVEDGTFEEIITLLYPTKTGEIGVVNGFFPYGDVRRYGAKCDGVTDDKLALNNAIANAQTFKFPVLLHDIMYVSETINTHGVCLIGDKQPTNSGANYPNGIGYDYPKNVNDGASITFSDYISTIVNGTAIVSDIANPILSTGYNENFNLNNFGVYGWLRNQSQEGLLETTAPEGVTYIPGRHFINNFSVFNTGSNGIHLHSLEVSTINNLIIELTNNYGLYIEGISAMDTPFDYNKIINCRIRYTRLAGIYLYKCYRQANEFNHCNFNYIGQLAFGHVNDSYGDRVQPSDDENIIYAIEIDDLNPTNAGQGRDLLLLNNYGEQLNGFIRIKNITTFSGITSKNNTFVRSTDSTNSVYMNLKSRYMYELDLDKTNSNTATKYVLANNVSEITTQGFMPEQFTNVISDKTVIFKNATKKGMKTFDTLYGNDVYAKQHIRPTSVYTSFNTASGSSQTVEMDLTDLIKEHFSSNYNNATGRPYALGLISLPASGDTTAAAVCDLVAITRHNGKYFISFLTNNTSATADTNGVVTITVPSWKVATFQFIQQIDTSLQ